MVNHLLFGIGSYNRLFIITLFVLFGMVSPLVAQQYCTPKYNFVDCNTLQRRAYIYNVQLNNRTFSTGCSQAGYAGIVNQTSTGVSDPIVLTSGFSYAMTVNTSEYDSRTYSGYNNQTFFAVWIDYDNNGVFDNLERIREGNSSNFSFTLRNNVAGTYRMRVRTQTTDPCAVMDYGETEDYTLKVVPPVPAVVDYDNAYIYCINSSYTLTANGCEGGTIRWYENNGKTFVGNNPATVKLSQGFNNSYSSTFYATCTINGLESNPASKNIYVQSVPPPSISSNNYNLTIGQTATLTAIGCSGGSYQTKWSNGAIGAQINVSPTQTTRYTATCSVGARFPQEGCTSAASNEVTVAVNAPSAPSISASKNIVCPNESVTLTAGNCTGTIKWSTGASGVTSITAAPTQQTDYSASCVISGIEGAKATTTVSVNPVTTITTQPNRNAVCEGTQTTFGVVATGSGNLTYLWSRNGQALTDSSATTSQLVLRNVTTAANGNYQVRVTGACGQLQSTAVDLQVSPKMTATAVGTQANCSGDASGLITVSTSGGLGDKQIRLGDQGDFKTASTITGLRAGSYTVQVRDAIGCPTQATATVGQPDRITFKITAPISAKCADGSDGAVIVEATGGNGGYAYAINGGTSQPSGQFLNLKANTAYIIRVVDAKGCSETTNVSIGAPNRISVNATPKSVLCADGNTGSINVTASGGNGIYRYQLDQNPQQTGASFANLKAGTYTVTVKDTNGCAGTSTVSVVQPVPVQVTAIATLVSCVSDTSASVNVTATGGTGSYRYQVGQRMFPAGNTTLTGFRVGSYTITAKDANECTASTAVTINRAEPLLAQAATQPASCCTCSDGVVTLTSSGGIGSKQYQLDQSAFQPSVTFRTIKPGQHTVLVRDETGCVTSLTATVTNATAATLTLTNLKNVSCAGGHDGSATIQVNGRQNGPLTYGWQTKNPSDSLGASATVTRLPEGEFTVTVTDTNRCTVSATASLTAQNPLPPKPTITTSGGNLVSSATSGVQWFSGTDLKTGKPVPGATQATFTPFQSSPYFVLVTANGCASLPSDAVSFILTALEPTMLLMLRVLPNPISGELRVEVDQPDRATLRIELIDVNGRTILNEQTPAFSGKRQFAWPLQNANAGVYLLQAEAGLRQTVQRVVVN